MSRMSTGPYIVGGQVDEQGLVPWLWETLLQYGNQLLRNIHRSAQKQPSRELRAVARCVCSRPDQGSVTAAGAFSASSTDMHTCSLSRLPHVREVLACCLLRNLTLLGQGLAHKVLAGTWLLC